MMKFEAAFTSCKTSVQGALGLPTALLGGVSDWTNEKDLGGGGCCVLSEVL